MHRTGDRPWMYKEKGSGGERDGKSDGALTGGVYLGVEFKYQQSLSRLADSTFNYH